MSTPAAPLVQPWFEEVQVAAEIPTREFGPLTIMDTVRWAGFQENWARLHFDREYVREHSGLRTFIASGAYRQALLVRVVTDWIGPRGWLRTMTLRQTSPTFEGDIMRFYGRVVAKSVSPSDPWLICELFGQNQDGQQIMSGRCTVTLPTKDAEAKP
jgi:acyl dehydratase